MKRNILLAGLMTMCAIGINAQEMTSEQESQIKKEINNIKRSEDVVYAESVIEYMADDSNEKITIAQQKSMQLLQTHVIEIFAKRMKMEKKDVQEIWDVIDDKCQNIEVRKGDIVRVFTYIMKDALGLSRSKPKEKDIQEYFGPNNTETQAVNNTDSIQATVPALAEVKTDTVSQPSNVVASSIQTVPATPENNAEAEEHVDSVKPVPTPIQSETPKEATALEAITPIASVPVAPATVTTPATIAPAVTTTSVVDTTRVAPTPIPAEPVQTPKVEPVADVQIPALCQTLIDKKDMTALLTYLDAEKAYEKLIYGSYRTMRKVEECYIVIVDKSTRKIVSVLDKGKTERMNFMTKKMDNYNNYRGGGNYSAVFVQEL